MTQKIGLEAVLEMANFRKGVKEYTDSTGEMEKKTGGFGKLLGGLGKGIAGAGVAAGAAAIGGFALLIGIIADSVGEASEAQQAQAQLLAVLKSTGGAAGVTAEQANALAASLQNTTMFSDEAVISAEALLLGFKNISSETFPQTIATAADLATRLGMDLPSAAKLLGKALEEPGEGLLRLKQAGVAFTEEQEAMIAKMVESGDAAGAQKFILDELNKSIGGAAVAAGDTFAGKMTILGNTISDVKEGIGNAFLPILITLVDMFSKFIQEHGPQITALFQRLADWLGEFLPQAAATLVGFWTTTLQPALKAVWDFISVNIIPILEEVFAWLGENLPKAIKFLGDYYAWLWNSILKPVFGWIGDTLIPILGDIFSWLFKNIPKAIDAVTRAFTWLKDNVLTPVANAFDAIGKAIQWVIEKIQTVITWLEEIGDSLPDWLIPGSPTPFEIGLLGINDAMRQIAHQGLPEMAFGVRGMAPAGAGATTSNSYGGDTIVLNINSRDAWAGAQSWIESRRRERINVGM